jgi:exopolysaccharide biosynthesis protein
LFFRKTLLVNKSLYLSALVFCGVLAEFTAAAQTATQPFLGVKLYHETLTTPRPLNINVLEIDLTAPGISFLVTPRGPAPQPVFNGVPDETVIQTPRQFVNSSGAQMAVNASFYAISEIHNVNGLNWTNNLGLTASKGDAYSPWEGLPSNDNNYDDALNITSANQATIVKMPSSGANGYTTTPSVTLYNTVTGKNRLLFAKGVTAPSGTACGSFCDPNPRTAAGVSKGGTFLYLMTVDGRQPGVSEGVTLVELANYMLAYGASDAINLDGGGSNQMAANYYSDGQSARLVNVPSEPERSVGTSLAVFALPNGDYSQNGVVDAADYAVWRKSIGGTYAYNAWRQKYGAAASGSAASFGEMAAIPEPSSWIVIGLGVLIGTLPRRTRGREPRAA